MADRTTARLFGRIISRIAELPASTDRNVLIRDVWGESSAFDFRPYQMESREAVEALAALGLVPDSEVERSGPRASR